ncbi:uncharacterized protein LOC115672951 [Syzygium oleosum]|uniref:uncharacterized protein LOC115672951 n=1 Tax=Syzygium oleosum TaxID=219896 RepID=UPI0011D1C7D9|nr:uncharacterized protein LOC115672951 [Syzygium oleosum]
MACTRYSIPLFLSFVLTLASALTANWTVKYIKTLEESCNAGKDKAPKASNLNPKSVSENLAIVSREAFMTRRWLPIILANSDLFPSAPYPVTSNTDLSEYRSECGTFSAICSVKLIEVTAGGQSSSDQN